MSNKNVSNNGVNESGVYNEGLSPGGCPVVRMCWPSRHQATVRNCGQEWLAKKMSCYYQSQPRVKGYRQTACFLERRRVVSSRRAQVVWSIANDSKERLAVTTATRGDKETGRKW